MNLITCADVLAATKGQMLCGNTNTVFYDVCTDSRKVKNGSLFIPLIGENFDGHDFIGNVFASGASGSLTSNPNLVGLADNGTLILVEDTLAALGALSAAYRKSFNVPVVGVTGSVGKTSTKEMIAAVLSMKYITLKTDGNFNNEIGVPLTLFRMNDEFGAMVIEMGMNHLNEISRLSMMANPDIGVITNIGLSHIENLGSRQNILKAKLEIINGMSSHGVLVINNDDPLLSGVKDFIDRRVVTFGTEEGADLRAEGIISRGEEGTDFRVILDGIDYEVNIRVPGNHNVYNALAALAVGKILGIPPKNMIDGIKNFRFNDKMRMNIVEIGGYKVINDSYNSSPDSVKAALGVLNSFEGRKIGIFGDMLELGEWTERAHREIGELSSNLDLLIAVGKYCNYTAKGAIDAGMNQGKVFMFDNKEDAYLFLRGQIQVEDVLLVKGSRGAKMEEIFNKLIKEEK